jgi:CO/xanthine dehydrogenase FAD-binding subunit
MKPPPFRYVAARDLAGAVTELGRAGGEGKVLAGGQSLMPMLNFRLLEPRVLVDIGRIEGLSGITEDGGDVVIGALTRHAEVEASPVIARRLPMLAAAMRHVAHLAIRNRGTFAGSLAHADPAAEIPLIARLMDARIETISPRGPRSIAATDFFVSALTTTLAPDEIITRVRLPAPPAMAGWGFEEVSRRPGDFAVAMVAVVIGLAAEGRPGARIALGGAGPTPLRGRAAEAAIAAAGALSPATIAEAAKAAAAEAEPPNDLHGSADYRRHLVEVLTRRALTSAAARAGLSLNRGGGT